MTDAPQVGDIGVVPGSGWVAAGIRLITRAPVAHSFLYIDDGQIVEGDPHGARYNQVTAHPAVEWLTNLSASITAAQRAGIAAWARSKIGTPYSWVDDAEIGFVDVFGWAPKWMRDRLGSDSTLMCSQLCDEAYAVVGVHLFDDNRPPGGVSPGDLWALNRKGS